MRHMYYMLWETRLGPLRGGGDLVATGWSGPHETIEAAKASVPESATASLITRPLPAMTPGEAREARPILGRS